MGSIIRVEKNKNYFAVSNVPFQDKNLSWEARGMMGYLLSKPDDWKIMFHDLVNQSDCGDYKVRRILKELEENKYLVRNRRKSADGKFFWESTIYENPTIYQLPTYGLPTRGTPTCGGSLDIPSTDLPSTNGKSTEEKSSSDDGEKREIQPPRENIYIVYENEIGSLTGMISEELDDIEKEFSAEWFYKAVKEAKISSTRVSLKYIRGILKRWKAEGLPTEYREEKKKRGQYEEIFVDGELKLKEVT